MGEGAPTEGAACAPDSRRGGGRIAYLGPPGTFSEEALLGEPDLAGAELVSMATIDSVLDAASSGVVDAGFVPIENAIGGAVAATADRLAAARDPELLVLREVVLEVHLHLLALPGTALAGVRRVVSFPHALAQCRRFLRSRLPGAEVAEARSTADAARALSEERQAGTAVVASARAGRLYGLQVLASEIEDLAGDWTRFVLVGRLPRRG